MAAPLLTCRRCGATTESDGHFCETCGLRFGVSQIQGPATLGPNLAVVTDIGKHHHRNEDAGAVGCELLEGQPAFALVVCDGVSSSSSSDQLAAHAAATARTALIDVLRAGPGSAPEAAVAEAIRTAHEAACQLTLEAEPGKDPPGSTIVAAVAWPGRISVGWLGDSRAYWVTANDAVPLTRDDSWLAEQVERGELSAEEAAASPLAHAITHCIGPLEGVDGTLTPNTRTFDPDPSCGGTLLLCSDGFWNYTADTDAVAALVRSASPDLDAEGLAGSLVQYALDRGGMDNVTVAVAKLH